MKIEYESIQVKEYSIDGLMEITDCSGNPVPFEYRLGLYYEMDANIIGEIANIKRLLENGFLPKSEKDAILLSLEDYKLDQSKRKAKERGIRKLKSLLLK